MTVKYCWIIYLKNVLRNPIVASRFHHSVGVQLPAFDILFVLNIARRQSEVQLPAFDILFVLNIARRQSEVVTVKYSWIIYL